MKLKIVAEGFETFTGQLGDVYFVDGVSDCEVAEGRAFAVAAHFQAVWVEEDGVTVVGPCDPTISGAPAAAEVVSA